MKKPVPVHHAFKLMGLWLLLLGTYAANAQCTANYTFSTDSLNHRTIHFSNLSTGPAPQTYRWTYSGVPGFDSSFNPTHTFPDSIHSATVCLTTYGVGGCVQAICKNINFDSIEALCRASFSFSADSSNSRIIRFHSTSTGAAPLTYYWNFGTGETGYIASPIYQFNDSFNSANVCLTVYGAGGCSDDTCMTFYFDTLPLPCDAQFTYLVDSANHRRIYFTNKSSGQAPMTYNWNFAGAATSNFSNPSYTFTTPGNKLVCLAISTPGCVDSICKLINIDSLHLCNVDFTYTIDSVNHRKVYFHNLSTGQPTLNFHWTFAGAGTSSVQNPNFTFSTPGNKTVCLIVFGPNCMDTVCKVINIDTITPCNADFSYTIDSVNRRKVYFTNLSVGTTTLAASWNFAGAGSSSLQHPSFTFSSPGYKMVCLTSYSANCLDTICKTIYIDSVSPCHADFSYVIQHQGQTIQFTNLSTGVAPLSYRWTLYRDSSIVGSTFGGSPTFGYSTYGMYTMCLMITSSNGCKDSVCKSFNTTPPCNADFVFTIDSVNKRKVYFTNLSTGAKPLTYLWNFNFGQGSDTARNPVFTFATTGNKTVCLVISGPSCRDTVCKTIHIGTDTIIPCRADFSYVIDSINPGRVFFSNLSTGQDLSSMSWSFNFGEGSSAAWSPIFEFKTKGNKIVCLAVSGLNQNCRDTICKTVMITADTIRPCYADFSAHPQGYKQMKFWNNSTYTGIGSFTWIFDSHRISTAPDPIFTFSSSGPKTVCLILNTATCSDTICRIVNIPVDTPCAVNFVYNIYPDTFGGTGRIVMFNSTVVDRGSHYAYFWNFGDGTTSYMADPVHYYASNGTYNVCLIALDTIRWCGDTICLPVRIEPDTVPTGVSEIQDMAHIKLYPVPVSQHLNIDLTLRNRTDVQVRVYDLLGMNHYEKAHTMQNGSNSLDVDLSGLNTGLYFIELKTQNQTLNYRVLKN